MSVKPDLAQAVSCQIFFLSQYYHFDFCKNGKKLSEICPATAAVIFSYQQQLDNGNILKMIKTTTKLGLLHSIFFNNSSVHKLFRGEKITFLLQKLFRHTHCFCTILRISFGEDIDIIYQNTHYSSHQPR